MQHPPARPGDVLAAIETPALLVDLPAFEENLATMARLAKAAGVRLRPHAKTHKSPIVALKQMALGAVGVCCQTLGEAEVLAAGGVTDVLVTNQVIGNSKLRRLAALARQIRLAVCVDDARNARDLSAAMQLHRAALDVFVEIDVGMQRCGIAAGDPAAELAAAIAALPGLRFAGLQAYHGRAQHLRGDAERQVAVAAAGAEVVRTLAALTARGLACPLVTGAGTGTFPHEAASGLWTELQCGSYVFMDADYARNRAHDGGPLTLFRQSLFVLASVISRPTAQRAVCDAGLKSVAMDSGPPVVQDAPDIAYRSASDEHGTLALGAESDLALGQKIRLVPGHCDPTVNLYDWYVGVRDDRVEALWPIAGRGASA